MKETSSNKGLGFLGALTLLFIGLKLCNVVNWTWLWVLSPIWLPTSLVIGIVIIAIVIAWIDNALEK